MVTWQSNNQDGSGYGIYGQLYNPIGDTIGEEFQVNSYTSGQQYVRSQESVATLEDGGFIITWMDQSGHDGGSGWDIRAQRYDVSGGPTGEEFMVNTYISGSQYQPSVSSLKDGGFVVTWEDHSSGSHGGTLHDIYGQRFDVNGDPAGGEFLVNEGVESGYQYETAVRGLANGRFIVTWRDDDGSNHESGSSHDIWGRVFNADGSEAISPFRVNTYVSSSQSDPSVDGFSDGSFIVAWESNSQDGSNYGIYAQRYDVDGAPVGDEFRVNTYTHHHQRNAEVTVLNDDSYVITWDSKNQDGSQLGLYGQIYNAAGNEVGNEFRANTYTSDDQDTLPSRLSLMAVSLLPGWVNIIPSMVSMIHTGVSTLSALMLTVPSELSLNFKEPQALKILPLPV